MDQGSIGHACCQYLLTARYGYVRYLMHIGHVGVVSHERGAPGPRAGNISVTADGQDADSGVEILLLHIPTPVSPFRRVPPPPHWSVSLTILPNFADSLARVDHVRPASVPRDSRGKGRPVRSPAFPPPTRSLFPSRYAYVTDTPRAIGRLYVSQEVARDSTLFFSFLFFHPQVDTSDIRRVVFNGLESSKPPRGINIIIFILNTSPFISCLSLILPESLFTLR